MKILYAGLGLFGLIYGIFCIADPRTVGTYFWWSEKSIRVIRGMGIVVVIAAVVELALIFGMWNMIG